jgi:Ca2+-binding RTX toxin-like protein
MFRHAVRLASVLAVVTAGAQLVAGPAGAQQPLPTPLPSMPCPFNWTNVIVGTDQAERIVGTSGNDLILGLGGDDVILGEAGRDTILGGDGDDDLAGGPGDDCILGGAGADDSVHLYFVSNGTDDTYSTGFRYEYMI